VIKRVDSVFKKPTTKNNGHKKYFSPTQQLLLNCALSPFNAPGKDVIQDLLDLPIDWSHFLKKAAYLGITPRCHQLLEPFYEKIPLSVSKKLSEAFLLNSVRNRALWKHFLSVRKAFLKANIKPLPIKGPFLSYILYGQFNLRRSSDLDILIPKNQLEQCKKALAALDYLPEKQPYSEDFIQKYLRHRAFTPRKKDPFMLLSIEIHWNLYPQGSQEFAMKALWGTAMPFRVENISLMGPSYDFILIYLAVGSRIHGYQNFWYFTDINALLKKYSDKIDWDHVIKQVRINKQKAALFFALYFTRELFQMYIPSRVLKQLKPGWIRFKIISFLISPDRILSIGKVKSSIVFSDLINLLTTDFFIDVLRSIHEIIFIRTDDMLGRYLKKGNRAGSLFPSFLHPFYLLGILTKKLLQQIPLKIKQ
jgi:hypothetical protein